MSVIHASLYYHFSLNFTTSALLLQCFVFRKTPTECLITPPYGKHGGQATHTAAVPRGFYIGITTGCSNYERSYIWEALQYHGCMTWSFTLICTAPVTMFTASTTEALTSCRQRTTVINHAVLKNGNFKINLIHCHIYTVIVNAFKGIFH